MPTAKISRHGFMLRGHFYREAISEYVLEGAGRCRLFWKLGGGAQSTDARGGSLVKQGEQHSVRKYKIRPLNMLLLSKYVTVTQKSLNRCWNQKYFPNLFDRVSYFMGNSPKMWQEILNDENTWNRNSFIAYCIWRRQCPQRCGELHHWPRSQVLYFYSEFSSPWATSITQKTLTWGQNAVYLSWAVNQQGREEKGREKGIIDPPFSTKCLWTNNKLAFIFSFNRFSLMINITLGHIIRLNQTSAFRARTIYSIHRSADRHSTNLEKAENSPNKGPLWKRLKVNW